MPRLTRPCPHCNKTLELNYELKLNETQIFKSYKCGHSFTEELNAKHDNLSLTSIDGTKKARNYQVDGVDFIVNGHKDPELNLINPNGFNCLIGDQQRLGKTPQAEMALASVIDDPTKFPVLIIVKAINMQQWIRESRTWFSADDLGIFPIVGTKAVIPKGFKCYIISRDTFSRDGMVDRLLEFGFKICIADEVHGFKNTASKRSQALVAFLKEINKSELTQEIPFVCMMCKNVWNETVTISIQTDTSKETKRVSKTSHCPKCYSLQSQSAAAHITVKRNCGIIMLSGTSIKNRASEYFVPLNIMAPDKFPSPEGFKRNWLSYDGKRILPYRLEEFKKAIAPFVLRREKEDVYKDLPPLNRMFTVIEMTDERLIEAYNKKLDEMEEKMARTNFTYFDNIGDLMILRQIAGVAKVPFCSDYVETCIYDMDKPKIAIGAHHHTVTDSLSYRLKEFGVVKIDGRTPNMEKDRLAHNYFERSPEACLVLGMSAVQEGTELFYISKCVVLERQFTSADEEQFEYRFYNPDLGFLESKGYPNKVTEIEYIIAKKTIDEWWYNMIEEKRLIFGETISNHWDVRADKGSFKKLLEETVSNRL